MGFERKRRARKVKVSKIALGSLLLIGMVASILVAPAAAYQVQVPTYYLNRTTTLTGKLLNPTAPGPQPETSIVIPRGSSAYFYSTSLAEGQISNAEWTVTVYVQADESPDTLGSLTVEISIYSMDGTTQTAVIGTSTGNTVMSSITKVTVTVQGVSAPIRNGDRFTVRLYAENGAPGMNSMTVYFDGQGNELAGDESRVSTLATKEEAWRQDFETNPFSLSSVNRYWQANGPGSITWDSSQSYTGQDSLHTSDKSGSGTYARYDFATANNPSQFLPAGAILSFYTLTSTNSKGLGLESFHIRILDQGRSYEYYWYWSPSNTTTPRTVYSSTSKTAGTYMGTITLGSWVKHELLDWRKHAELALGLTFVNPRLTSLSLQSNGPGPQPTDVYWDNIFVTSYTLTVQPARTEEGQTTTISLTVTGAIPQTSYQFEFTVTDPNGSMSLATMSHTTGASETSFVLSKYYPDDFQAPGGLAGVYNVLIRETGPVYLIPVGNGFITNYVTASTNFTVHLSDRASYQRTETVRVQATGYQAYEHANITFSGPIPTSMYLVMTQADATGMIVTTWQIPRDAQVGNYNSTVNGTVTVKTVPDTDRFAVTEASVQLTRFTIDSTNYQRTQNVTLHASMIYPGQLPLVDGHLFFQAKQPDGLLFLSMTVLGDGSGGYTATFKIPNNAETGSWIIIAPAWDSGDSYGNTGPGQITMVSFNVFPAVLQVQSDVSIDQSQSSTRTLQIQAVITYPDGTQATSGQAMAQLQHNGVTIVNVPLSFDTVKGTWVGYYQIRPDDPEGLWLVIISAQDLTGPVSNSIQNVVHNVLVDAPSSYWNMNMSLMAGMLVPLAALITFLVWKLFPRRKSLSVALETEKVMQTVNKVQSTDFFRSIREQLASASSMRNEGQTATM